MDRHFFIFNPRSNGGEQVYLSTEFIKEEGEIHLAQQLTLGSYCNAATFSLEWDLFSPEKLRKLADELDKERVLFEIESMKDKKVE